MPAHELTHGTGGLDVIAGRIDDRQPHPGMVCPRVQSSRGVASAERIPTRQRKGGSCTNLGAHGLTDDTG
jgi:hypothetical protein